MGVRQLIFIICCASITGLSYLLSYCYIVIVNRLAGHKTTLYISAGAIAQWAFCALSAHFFFMIYNKVRLRIFADAPIANVILILVL